jgi:hypothetical protein
MSWAYDPKTRTTGPTAGLISRVQLEDAIDALKPIIPNRSQLTDALVRLTSLSWREVALSVDLNVEPSMEISNALDKRAV